MLPAMANREPEPVTAELVVGVLTAGFLVAGWIVAIVVTLRDPAFIRDLKAGAWLSGGNVVAILIFWVTPFVILPLGGALYRRWRRRRR